MSNDKIRLNAPSVAGGKDVATHTLASGEDIGRSTLAIYTPGAGSTPGTAADIDDTNPLPTKLIDIGTAATDAHILDAVAALGDILAALGATLDVSGSVSVSSAVDVASLPSLSAGSNTIGNVGIAGTLPAFASPPAVTASWATAQHVIVDTAPTTAVTNASLDAALSTLATQATLSALNTKIPSSPATDRATAAAPFAVRLSDGSAFLSALPITDNSGSLSVDAPVGTPVFVRLSDGSSAITTLPVSAASLPLPSGAATAANQTTIATNTGATTTALTGSGTIAGWSPFITSALLTSTVPAAVLKNSAGTLGSFSGTNGTGATCYIQVHNATSTGSLSSSTLIYTNPASTTNGTTAALTIPTGGISCSTGIVVAWSSTQYTYTSPGTTNTGGAVGSYK
jgi:hypothetical protein